MSNYDALALQKDRYARGSEAHQEFYARASKCREYVFGKQWNPADAAKLRESGRPVLTFNKIAPVIMTAIGLVLQNQFDIRYIASGKSPDENEVAADATRIAKELDEQNGAKWNETTILRDGFEMSRGFLRVQIEPSEDDEDIEEVTEAVVDPFNVIIDPEGMDYDPKTWGWVIERKFVSFDDLAVIYGPKAEDDAIDAVGARGSEYANGYAGQFFNFERDRTTPFSFKSFDEFMYSNAESCYDKSRRDVLLIDCQHYRRVETWKISFVDGTEVTLFDPDVDQAKRALEDGYAAGVVSCHKRKIKRVLWWTVTAGNTVLWDGKSPYDTPTLIPFFPNLDRLGSKGVVDDLIDPQQDLNKRRSATLALVSATSNAPWMVPKGSMDEVDHINLKSNGAYPGAVINYDPVMGHKPHREPPIVAAGEMRALERADSDDIMEISGINASMMGKSENATSGEAIKARQTGSALAMNLYMENFDRFRELKGRKYLELMRILGLIPLDCMLRPYVESTPATSSWKEGQSAMLMKLKQMGIPIPNSSLVELIDTFPGQEKLVEKLRAAEDQQDQAGGQMMPPDQLQQAQQAPQIAGVTPVGG